MSYVTIPNRYNFPENGKAGKLLLYNAAFDPAVAASPLNAAFTFNDNGLKLTVANSDTSLTSSKLQIDSTLVLQDIANDTGRLNGEGDGKYVDTIWGWFAHYKAVAKTYADGLAAALQAAITAEEVRATAAEEVNTAAITAEAARAKAAEGVNAAAITAETTRATAAEGVNAAAITDEATRATLAEVANATAITAETTRATLAEGVNATTIAAVDARVSQILDMSPDDLNQLKELVEDYKANGAAITNLITAESTYARAAEDDLYEKIKALEDAVAALTGAEEIPPPP